MASNPVIPGRCNPPRPSSKHGQRRFVLEGRDDWIGWNSSQRSQHLERVLNMNRFLIRPMVRCANLASHALSLCAQQVSRDFERRYGLRPWLLESFVETPTYIAIDAVIAWRIMLLALLGREVPELPCEALFNPVECDVPGLPAKKKGPKPTLTGRSHDPYRSIGWIARSQV